MSKSKVFPMPPSSPPPVIDINRGPWRKPIRFYSPQDVGNFLDQEQMTWHWTSEPLGGIFEQAISPYRPDWIAPIREQIDAWIENSQHNIDALRSSLQTRFADQGRLSSLDHEAHAVGEIAKISARTGAATLLAIQGRIFDPNLLLKNEDVRVGQAKGLAILAGTGPETIPGIKHAQELAVQSLERKSSALSDEIQNLKISSRSSLDNFSTQSAEELVKIRNAYVTSHEQWSDDVTNIRSTLEAITKTYETQMQLRGPVRYWQNRSTANRNWSFIVLASLVLFSVLSCYLLYQLFEHTASLLPEKGQELDYAKLFKASAFSILMTTIVLWAAKIMLRIYFSLRHLATDAAERMTMTMTFLALLRSKSVSDEDRKLILQALFRPASDGIVKDDFSVDPAAAGIIGALLKR